MKSTGKDMVDSTDIIGMLEKDGIPYSLIEHKRVFSIAELDEIDAKGKDAIVKNIVLCDDKKRSFYFLTVSPHIKVDLKALRRELSSRPLSFLNEEKLHELLKIGRGEATPFALLNDEENIFTFLLDESLYDKTIGIHPNDNSKTVFINSCALVEILKEHGERCFTTKIPQLI